MRPCFKARVYQPYYFYILIMSSELTLSVGRGLDNLLFRLGTGKKNKRTRIFTASAPQPTNTSKGQRDRNARPIGVLERSLHFLHPIDKLRMSQCHAMTRNCPFMAKLETSSLRRGRRRLTTHRRGANVVPPRPNFGIPLALSYCKAVPSPLSSLVGFAHTIPLSAIVVDYPQFETITPFVP